MAATALSTLRFWTLKTSSERSNDSTVMSYFWRAISSKRVVLKAVVRAPMQPMESAEIRRQRMHHVGLEHGEGDAALREDVRDGELAAEGVAAVGEVHLADFVGVGLEEDGDARVAQGLEGAVLVGEDRHGEDHAVILAPVLGEPLRVEASLVARLHAAEARGLLVHHDRGVAGVLDGLGDLAAGAENQFAGHEAAVAEAKRERGLPAACFHVHSLCLSGGKAMPAAFTNRIAQAVGAVNGCAGSVGPGSGLSAKHEKRLA